MQTQPQYDVAIVGGGLAGLASAILLRRQGYTVVLFEKEAFPFHKVCGEYISMESWDFLQSLGLPLGNLNLPRMHTLHLTAPNGNRFTTALPLGGFGISRYRLDQTLAMIAREAGVHLLENTRVDEIDRNDDYSLRFHGQRIRATLCLGAWGKRSNLDVKWKRPFLQEKDSRLNNYVGVKYHVKTAWPDHVIGLHNFENGYCGISKIEGDNYCLCYMTRAVNLKQCDNSIERLQEHFLYRNPHLETIFRDSDPVPGFPLTISQISFAKKAPVEKGVLMLGDTAGMIAPLCGNGMSIALHTGKIAATLGDLFLQKKISRQQLEGQYTEQWQKLFSLRLRAGRILQSFFGSNRLSNGFVGLFRQAPFLAKPVIRLTHGKPF